MSNIARTFELPLDMMESERATVIAWIAAQDVDPTQVVAATGFRVTEFEDGRMVWHYLEFQIEDGRRIMCPGPSGYYDDKITYMKRPRLKLVTDRLDLLEEKLVRDVLFGSDLAEVRRLITDEVTA